MWETDQISIYLSICQQWGVDICPFRGVWGHFSVYECVFVYTCVCTCRCVCLGFAEAHIWPSSTFLSHWNRITHGSNDKRGKKYESADWLMSGSAFDSEFRISVFDSLSQIEARQMWRTKRSQIFVSFSLIFHWFRETSYSTVVKWDSFCCEVLQHAFLSVFLHEFCHFLWGSATLKG